MTGGETEDEVAFAVPHGFTPWQLFWAPVVTYASFVSAPGLVRRFQPE